jgi:hypothetical protein
MFVVAPIRSPPGREALKNLIGISLKGFCDGSINSSVSGLEMFDAIDRTDDRRARERNAYADATGVRGQA